MRKFLPILFPLLLSACVTAEDVTANLDRLIGKPLSAAVRKYGPPVRSYTTDGSTWHAWSHTGAYYGASSPLTCEWSVEVSDGKIVATNWGGNWGMCEQMLGR